MRPGGARALHCGARRAVAERRLRIARNVELKAHDPDPSSSLEVSLALGATDEGWLQQRNYRIIPIHDPDGLKDALAAALGILVAVEKSRHLLLWRNVRIHLDEVPGLGSFIELEAVAEPDYDLSGEYDNAAELRKALGITDERILAVGYSDELLRVSA